MLRANARSSSHRGTATTDTALDRGRASFARRAWGSAYAELSAADQDEPLAAEDLERLSMAASLIGKDDESDDIGTRAHHEHLRLGDPCRAARVGFWLGMSLFNRGELARSGGWMARAHRLLEESEQECVEQGYLMVPVAIMTVEQAGDAQGGFAMFEQIGKIAERFGDPELLAMSRMGRGQALIQMGETAEGVRWLDEVMIAVTTEDLTPIFTGIAYCAVIGSCLHIFDLRRAQEWTAELTRWCSSDPGMIAFRGECLVNRASIMQIHGSWPEAVAEALLACELASQPWGHWVVGPAFYRLADMHRLLGEFEQAEDGYRQAGQRGESPQPGLALMRLAQGQSDAAAAAIRRELDEAKDPLNRAKLLPAFVEIMLAVGDRGAARSGAEELSRIADGVNAPYLRALAQQATAAVLLAEGDARAALTSLREASGTWRELEAPYEAARTAVLIGLACRELADEDSCRMELEGARQTFQELGAKADLASVERLLPSAAPPLAGGLTAREVEVLRLVAAGKSNRAVASELVISEKTVARHVSNIFTKLGVSSRAAATAYAYQHGLV
jgi:DNA-binding CsgD family transcriptional regulator